MWRRTARTTRSVCRHLSAVFNRSSHVAVRPTLPIVSCLVACVCEAPLRFSSSRPPTIPPIMYNMWPIRRRRFLTGESSYKMDDDLDAAYNSAPNRKIPKITPKDNGSNAYPSDNVTEDNVSKAAPKDDVPRATPKNNVSEATPKDEVSKTAPVGVPKNIKRGCSKGTPNAVSKGTLRGRPKGTPKSVSKGVPKGTPRIALKGTLRGVRKGTTRSVGKGTARIVRKVTAKSVRKGTAKSVRKGTAKSVRKGTVKSVGKGTAKSVRKGTAKSVRKGTAKSVRKGTAKSVGKGTAKSVRKVDKIPEDTSEEETDTSDEEYEVDKILIAKQTKRRMFYHIKWTNCPYYNCTWEPEENLTNCEEVLNDFMNKQK